MAGIIVLVLTGCGLCSQAWQRVGRAGLGCRAGDVFGGHAVTALVLSRLAGLWSGHAVTLAGWLRVGRVAWEADCSKCFAGGGLRPFFGEWHGDCYNCDAHALTVKSGRLTV